MNVIKLLLILCFSINIYATNCNYYINESKKYKKISSTLKNKEFKLRYNQISEKYKKQYKDCIIYNIYNKSYKGFR
jgi:regulatory protein YycH of two-component signal transduction system YycFG